MLDSPKGLTFIDGDIDGGDIAGIVIAWLIGTPLLLIVVSLWEIERRNEFELIRERINVKGRVYNEKKREAS